MDKFERKFGKYAIRNLSLVLIICYAIGYGLGFVEKISGVGIINFLTLNPYAILHGQVWRIFTWILVPPDTNQFTLFTILMLFFYYSIGTTLENTWGSYLYNVYIFAGMLFTVVGSFLLLAYISFFPMTFGDRILSTEDASTIIGYFFSTYYVNMSIFLAFAATFPNNQVLLMFFIPIKIKWMGIAYALLLAYDMLIGDVCTKFVIIASLLNFIVFFIWRRNKVYGTPTMRVKQAARRHEFKSDIKRSTPITKHKCAICGRTEIDSPDMEFRFCSKCNGNYEYCSEHLFTHKHVE